MNVIGSLLGMAGQSQSQSQAQVYGAANGLQAQNAAAINWPPLTVADTAARLRKTYAAKQKVLEFFEAQLALDLFKDDPAASTIFQEGIVAAIQHMEKSQ